MVRPGSGGESGNCIAVVVFAELLKAQSPKGAPFGVVDGVKHNTTEVVDGTANQTVRLDLGTRASLRM